MSDAVPWGTTETRGKVPDACPPIMGGRCVATHPRDCVRQSQKLRYGRRSRKPTRMYLFWRYKPIGSP